MRIRALLVYLSLVLTLLATALPASPVSAQAVGVPPITNLAYQPEPAISAIPPRPDPGEVPKANPTGTYNAYDMNVYETIWFPQRQAADETKDDAPGGAIEHGHCPEVGCANHANEFKRFWKKTMKEVVGPFGGTVRSYPFVSPGSGTPDGAPLNSPGGPTYNLQATIPGSENPEQMVIVSGHFDQTDSGPASAWDSAEGHATVIRIAKMMTDYWKKTGTRPTASVKFTAWGAEEAGTFGSKAYIRDNLVPFPNLNVRGYFNLDPCGGGYPAYYRGNPADRVPLVMQLGDPAQQIGENVQEFENFNKQARVLLGDVFNNLDDTLSDVPTEPEIFVSDEEAEKAGVASQETEVVTAVGGLFAFSSDYANFEEIGVPIYNLFADVLGPHADLSYRGYREDGLAILHTPQDNLKTLNALTGIDQTGLVPSQGWYKGLEMCAHLHSWFMLQRNMSGSAPLVTKPTAYFEAKQMGEQPEAPFEAKRQLRFGAWGSNAFANTKGTRLIPRRNLKFRWSFGDGSSGRGLVVKHAYAKDGIYKATLTVIAPTGRDTMNLLIKVGA